MRRLLLLCTAAACGPGASALGDGGPRPDAMPLGTLIVLSGEAQTGDPGTPIPQDFVVQAADLAGGLKPNVEINWRVFDGGGTITPATSTTGADGTTRAHGTYGPQPAVNVFIAEAPALHVSVEIHAYTHGLAYVDPPPGGKVRLVRDPSSTAQHIVFRLEAEASMQGYTVGFDLPMSGPMVTIVDFTPGTVLPAGANPTAAKAVIPNAGPLANALVIGQSQKASGDGAVATDSPIAPGDALFTFALEPDPQSPSVGVVFDGNVHTGRFSAGVRNLAGSDVASAFDFRIGRLELH
jgi:hypothetical protein